MGAKTMQANEIVDRGASSASLLLKIPTEGQLVGADDARTAVVTAAQLGQALGVKTSGQFNVNAIQIGQPTIVGDKGALYGFTFHHGDGSPINTPTRHVHIADGHADAYNFLHSHNGAFSNHELPIHPTEAKLNATLTDNMLDYKRLLRWRANPEQTGAPFYDLLTPESVTAGVTRSVMGDDRRMIVLPSDNAGNVNAVHQLVMRNKARPDFFGGKYADGARNDINFGGRDGFVMTETDFNTIAEPLKASLDTVASEPLSQGLVVRAHKLDAAFDPTHIYLPITFKRAHVPLSEDFGKPFVSLNDVAAAVDGVTEQGASMPSLTAAIHGVKEAAVEATFEELVPEVPE